MPSPATTELTKLLVAATDCSVPACRSIAKVAAWANGEPAVLVSAMPSAPLRTADCAMATMSGLLPDCEIEIAAQLSSCNSRPKIDMIDGPNEATGTPATSFFM